MATEQKKEKGHGEFEGVFSRKHRMGGKRSKTQKEIDKELRKQYDKGKAYDEDEDDVARMMRTKTMMKMEKVEKP